ncbi:hypothetical protein AAMO2058_000498100 [Amorphochlora amoebiformis]
MRRVLCVVGLLGGLSTLSLSLRRLRWVLSLGLTANRGYQSQGRAICRQGFEERRRRFGPVMEGEAFRYPPQYFRIFPRKFMRSSVRGAGLTGGAASPDSRPAASRPAASPKKRKKTEDKSGKLSENGNERSKKSEYRGGKKSEEISHPPSVTRRPPEDWREVFRLIQQMRGSQEAPVDVMGCERLADEKSGAKVMRFQSLVALMISSQTTDQVTSKAIQNLKTNLKGGLCVSGVLQASIEDLESFLYPAGFYRRKAQYIKKTAEILHKDFSDDIPPTVDALCNLPGVGPKMAYLCMQCAWKVNAGIGVDVHVHRISNRLGWVKTSEPEQTRRELESWLPKEHWTPINPLLVGLGQTVCKSRRPLCGKCAVSHLCPSSQVLSNSSAAL